MVFTELLDEEENAGKKPDAEKVKKTKDQPFPLVPYLSIGYMLMYFA